jgi:protein-S-isoprenylcysteine O-methyltransferase Ste14
MPSASDHPDTLIAPPILLLLALGLGIAFDNMVTAGWPLGPAGFGLRLVGLVLLVAGFGLAFWAARLFRRAGTALPVWQAATVIVRSGPYAWSRNPIYVGALLAYLGIALALRSNGVLWLLPAVALLLEFGVVRREEAYLEGKFGEAYLGYKRSVRRWL